VSEAQREPFQSEGRRAGREPLDHHNLRALLAQQLDPVHRAADVAAEAPDLADRIGTQ
jgi:hypothetical protein